MPLASAGDIRPDNDPLLLQEWKDAVEVMTMPGFDPEYAVLKYVFSVQYDKLFYILGDGGKLYFGRVTDINNKEVNKDQLLELHERYCASYVNGDNEADVALHEKFIGDHYAIWRDLFMLFLQPVAGISDNLPNKEVLYQCKMNIDGVRIAFNLSMLYDLSFRHCKKAANEPLYFTNVSVDKVAEYFQGMQNLPCPIVKQMVLLDGFDRDYMSMLASGEAPEELSRVKMREGLFNRAMAFFENGGGRYMKLDSVKQFEELCSVGSEKRILQVHAHYHDFRLHKAQNEWIRFKHILSAINALRDKGLLRSDIIIDGSTCTNFSDFQALKTAGIAYLYYRNHEITTDLAVLIFLEMYSGFLAKQLNWDFPYIDGKTHLHIIYSKINRAFYVAMNLYKKIKTPDIMEKAIIVEGQGLSKFLDYIEDTHEEQNTPEFEFQANFDKQYNKKGDAVLISLLLTGMAGKLGELLIDYFLRDVNNEITITGKTADGQDISITMRNRTAEEVKEFLDKIGMRPENN